MITKLNCPVGYYEKNEYKHSYLILFRQTGCIEYTVDLYPVFLYVQVRMQAQKENGGRETFTQAFVKIYKQEGVPGLWRVNKVSVFL